MNETISYYLNYCFVLKLHIANKKAVTLFIAKSFMLITVVLEKTLESPWDCKEIQPVRHKVDQSWVFIGRTDVGAEIPILWPPVAKS